MKNLKAVISLAIALIMMLMCFSVPTLAADEVTTIEDAAKALGISKGMTSPVMKEVFYDDFNCDLEDVDYIADNTAATDSFSTTGGKFTFHKSTTGTSEAGFRYMGRKDNPFGQYVKNIAVIEYELTIPDNPDNTTGYPYFYISENNNGAWNGYNQIQTYINCIHGNKNYGRYSNTAKNATVNVYDCIGSHTYTYVIDYAEKNFYLFVDGVKYPVSSEEDLLDFKGQGSNPSNFFRFFLWGTDANKEDYQLDDVRIYEIVEDTEDAEDYTYGDPIFPESYTTGDNIITLPATKNNQDAADVVAIAAIYDGNELIGVSAPGTIENNAFTMTVNLNVAPENAKAKIFVWDSLENMIPQMPVFKQPASALGVKPKVAILRFDDLTVPSIPYFEQVAEYIEADDELTACFGIIGETWEKDATSTDFDKLKNFNNLGIELWNHGYAHYKGTTQTGAAIRECRNTPYDFQYERILTTQNIVKENTGITIKTFCAAHNTNDTTTLEVLENIPDLDTYMYLMHGDDSFLKDESRLNLNQALDIEDNDGRVYTYDEFLENYNNNTYEDYCILLGHPGNWGGSTNAHAFETFEKIIEFLKSEGVTFMTPSGYHEYISNNS